MMDPLDSPPVMQDDADAMPRGLAVAGSGRRRLAPDERRAQILDAAVTFFAEVGLEGRTRDLAHRLGITQSVAEKYFANKEALLEAVVARGYIDRLSPAWPTLLRDRRLPIRDRMLNFYDEYTRAIFTFEWMRIFMFSGLAGERLNDRYLTHMRKLILEPMRDEIAAAAAGTREPDMEDIWNLHGGIVYLGIRRFIYRVETPEDIGPAVMRAVDRLLKDFDADGAA